MKKCGLLENANKCEFYNKENKTCLNSEKCSYQDFDADSINPNRYIRKERWYEKYYK